MEETIATGIWKHYKGGLYVVLGQIRHHDGPSMVLYMSLKYGTINVRPLRGRPGDPDGWLEPAQASGLEDHARFEYVGPARSGEDPR